MNETNEKLLYYAKHLRNDIMENLQDHDVLYTQVAAWAGYIARMSDELEALRARLTLTEQALAAAEKLIDSLIIPSWGIRDVYGLAQMKPNEWGMYQAYLAALAKLKEGAG